MTSKLIGAARRLPSTFKLPEARVRGHWPRPFLLDVTYPAGIALAADGPRRSRNCVTSS